MAVDFGGLDYTISVRDQFSSNVDAFRAGITGARKDFRALKTELASPIRSGGQRELAKATRETANALRDETKAIRSARRERRDAVKVLSLSRAAKIALGRETRKLAIAQAKANLEVRRNLVNSRQQLAADQLRVRAERDLSKVIDARGRSERVLAAAKERGLTLSTEELRKLKLLTLEQEKLFLAKKKLAEQEAIAGNTELRRIQAETAAIKLENIELQKAANLRAIQARRPIGGGGRIPEAQFVSAAAPVTPATAPQTFRDRIRDFLQLSAAQTKAAESANRFSFTFRRLIGILAAFTVVRLIVRGFTDLVRQLVLFNANIEQSTLGIAALFTAVGDVRDATGEAASAAQSLAIAQKEARRQTQLLRRDALKTAATFDTLLETFQVAVAPGLAAGLDIDEIRDFTVRISQAASAIGLQQNQLAEEIRSILSGTIQARTTRIAVALGITNEDIRLAKEAGVLTQFLNERFIAFKQAGEEALGTFNALLTNTRDAILLLFEEGGLDFFEELKGLLGDIQASIRTTDITGALTPNPAAVGIVRAIADGLQSAVARVRELVSEDALGGLAGLATIIGQTINIISAVFLPIIAGVLSGLNDVRKIFIAIGDVARELGLGEIFGGELIAAGVKQLVRFVTLISTIGLAAVVLLGSFKAINATLRIGVALMTTQRAILLSQIAVVALLVLAFKEVVEQIIGAQVGFAAFIRIVTAAVVTAFKRLIIQIKAGVAQLFNALLVLSVKIFQTVSNIIFGIAKGLLALLATVSDTAVGILEDTISAQEKLNNLADKSIAKLKRQISLRDQERKAALRAADLELAAAVDVETDAGIKNAIDLKQVLSEIPGIISRQRQPLEAQGKLLKELADDAKKAADALRFSGETLGLGGNVVEQRRIEFEALIALREKGLILTNQEADSQKELTDIAVARVRNEKTLNALGEGASLLALETVDNEENLLRTTNKLARAETEVSLARLRFRAATDDEAEIALERLATAENVVAELKSQVTEQERIKAGLSIVLTSNLKTKEAQEAVTKVIKDRILLNGREVVANERLRGIESDRARLSRLINQSVNDRIRLVSQENVQELRTDALENRIILENERLELAARGLGNFQQEAIAIQGSIRLAEARLALQQETAILRKGDLEDIIQRRKETEESFFVTNADLDLQQQISLILERQAAAQKNLAVAKAAENKDDVAAAEKQVTDAAAILSTLRAIEQLEVQIQVIDASDIERAKALRLEIQKLKKDLEEAQLLKIDPFPKQARDAMDEALIRLGTFGISVVQKFADFASNAIVDAFDPTKDVNLKERFAAFLQDIARQIIALTIKIAILRAFGGVGGAATGGLVTTSPPRFAAGGGRVGPFANARGFDGGGVPNQPAPSSMIPKGLPPTDKVPIWTSAGEWIIKQSSAAKYGNAVMSAINRGLLDPTALRSLAGIGGRHTVRHSRGPGFQEGGLISDAVQAQRAADEQAAEQEGPGLQVLPTLLADRQTMQRLLDGGGDVLLDFMRENNTVISSADQLPG